MKPTYYYYHKDGHWEAGSNLRRLGIRYDVVDEVGGSWENTLEYIKKCCDNSSPKKPYPEIIILMKIEMGDVTDIKYFGVRLV